MAAAGGSWKGGSFSPAASSAVPDRVVSARMEMVDLLTEIADTIRGQGVRAITSATSEQVERFTRLRRAMINRGDHWTDAMGTTMGLSRDRAWLERSARTEPMTSEAYRTLLAIRARGR